MSVKDKYEESWNLYKMHSEIFSDDLDYYSDFCNGFPSLDIFSGYGRLTNPRWQSGVDVESVELNENLSKWIETPVSKKHIGDVLAFEPKKQYQRVIAGYNSFCLFTDELDFGQKASRISSSPVQYKASPCIRQQLNLARSAVISKLSLSL